MVEYRPLGDEHREAYWALTRYAFRPEHGPAEYDPETDEDGGLRVGSRRGLFPDDGSPEARPRCVCAHHWFDAFIRGQWHPAPGLAAVASPPEHRRDGNVTRLLEASLEEYRSRGDHFSILWPFRYQFYRQYGWETCTDARQYSCVTHRLAFARDRLEDPGRYRRVTSGEHEAAATVYDAFVTRYSLGVTRDPSWWRHRVFSGWETDPYVYVWERNGEPRAFITYTIDGSEDGRTLAVSDLAFVDTESFFALLAFCANHDSQVSEVTLGLPRDVRLLDAARHPDDIECTHTLGAMARIVDVVETLGALRYPDIDAAVRLSVTDPLVEWNDGTFRLTVRNGDATCEAIADAEGTALAVDIGVLTQLAVGYRTAEQLAEDGRIDGSAGAVQTLQRLFPPTTPYLGTRF